MFLLSARRAQWVACLVRGAAAAALLLLPLSSRASSPRVPLSLTIQLHQDTFVMAEPVVLRLTLTNVSSETLVVASPFGSTVACTCISIVDSTGEEMRFELSEHLAVAPIGRRVTEILAPGERIVEKCDLLTGSPSSRGFRSLLHPGTYSVRASYEYRPPHATVVWWGRLLSETREFKVLEPAGVDRSALPQMVLFLQETYWGWKWDSEGGRRLEQVIQWHPASAYVRYALYYLGCWTFEQARLWPEGEESREIWEYCGRVFGKLVFAYEPFVYTGESYLYLAQVYAALGDSAIAEAFREKAEGRYGETIPTRLRLELKGELGSTSR